MNCVGVQPFTNAFYLHIKTYMHDFFFWGGTGNLWGIFKEYI